MKLCPQCEFIYEDDQSFCDMDGNALVKDSGALAFAGTPISAQPHDVIFASEETTIVTQRPVVSELRPTRNRSRGVALVGVIALILFAIVLAVYFVRSHRQQRVAPATSAPQQSSSVVSRAEAARADQNSTEAAAVASPAQLSSASSSVETSDDQPPVSEVANPMRLAAGPVSARHSAGDSNSAATIWLKNGSAMKTDEVWEKREGIWYRQGGLVTFLKRSQVKAMQRLNSPTGGKSQAKKKSMVAARQSQPSPVAANTVLKKESRVGSFLKKTGRILKAPFKF
jgi:hypothetical protein